MRNLIHRSIKWQIIVAFMAYILLTILLVVFLNVGFLERFYLHDKEEKLLTGYETFFPDVSVTAAVDTIQYCNTNNIVFLLTNMGQRDSYIGNVSYDDYQKISARLFGYMSGLEAPADRILHSTDQYTIQYNRDDEMKIDYLELWGIVSANDTNYAYIFRTPWESIASSVRVSNQFYLFIGGIMAALGVGFASLFASRITRPLTELTQISQRMANLDFEARYTSGGDDEIGTLGHNFNRMSSTLEETISELKTANNELQKDIEKKEQIDEMRKEFLSNVSHELKTPIALIQGYAEGLQENINDDPESRAFYCEVIMDEASKMNQMVKKLLTLNQLEFGNNQVSMERFDLTDLIQGVIQSSQLLAQQAQAEILFAQTEPLYVWGDEFMLEQVVTNYLTNAIHYVKNEKKIEIRCQEENGKIRTTVFNTGDAIPEEELDKIWVKFYKVDKARTREYGGSGIGLSIVKAVMESMNQQCGVVNYDNGVAFWFTLDHTSTEGQEQLRSSG